MTAGEARLPRKNLPNAFNGVFFRLTTFFILGSLCVGIVVPYSDPDLLKAISSPHSGAGASPYVIAMQRLQIGVLPHIVNALVLTSIFSAGNNYVYCASRTLLGLSLEGKAPRFLSRCTSEGVPIYCVGIAIGVGSLGEHCDYDILVRTRFQTLEAFLQVSNNSAVVLQWRVSFYFVFRGFELKR